MCEKWGNRGLIGRFRTFFTEIGRLASYCLPIAANRLQFNPNKASRLKLFVSGNLICFFFFLGMRFNG